MQSLINRENSKIKTRAKGSMPPIYQTKNYLLKNKLQQDSQTKLVTQNFSSKSNSQVAGLKPQVEKQNYNTM